MPRTRRPALSRLTTPMRCALALPAIVLAVAVPAVPTLAQDTMAEARIRKIEAEVRALQRQVFPGSDGKVFAPEIPAGTTTTTVPGRPATTPVTDILTRMDALEAQVARLTAQLEDNTNRIGKIEARLGGAPVASPTPAATTPAATATPSAAPTTTATPAATVPAARPATTAKPAAKPAAPSAQRLAAVRAIEKPQTADAGDDEYSYGFRLWEAKFYPEAQQQLKLMIDKYPRHARISYARNLLGRAFLDDNNPREAGTWFYQNYNANKAGDRAPDSLLYLAEAMRRLNDSNRACIALSEFVKAYPREAAGRLKGQYDQTLAAVKCN